MVLFVPTGYLPIARAITRMVEAREPELSAHADMEQAEWQSLCRRRASAAAVVASLINVGSGVSGGKVSRGHGDPFTLADQERLAALELRRAKHTEAQHQERFALRQALGDGVLKADGIKSDGVLVAVPVEAWRTVYGIDAMVSGKIRWGELRFPLIVDALLREADFQNWLNRTIAPPQTKQTRKNLSPHKVNEWMTTAASKAVDAGQFLKRDDAVLRCQEALGCTRPIARAAFAALPPTLKRSRGKPAINRPE